ncbi:L1 protein [Papillomaviridae sp. Haddock_c45]|nr:L1 protein [Papillomaviridae sp. Haddock_c45]
MLEMIILLIGLNILLIRNVRRKKIVLILVFQMLRGRHNNKVVVRPNVFEGGVPVSPVMRSTDEFTHDTGLVYAVTSQLMSLIGHPHYDITKSRKRRGKTVTDVILPMVSPFQFRVFELNLPDPNHMSFPETLEHRNLSSQRYVWSVEMVEVTRNGPLGVPLTGNSMFAKFADIENPVVDWTKREKQKGAKGGVDNKDGRVMVGFDGKQTQFIAIGAKPLKGFSWTGTESGVKGGCPILTRVVEDIKDGDLGDIGFGNIDPATLCLDEWHLPIEMKDRKCVSPDIDNMLKDGMGDCMFMYINREQLFAKHFWDMAGNGGEVTEDMTKPLEGKVIPSGSLAASAQSIFGKPYWLNQSVGPNNGLLWDNKLYVTCMDTTHGASFNIVVPKPQTAGDGDQLQQAAGSDNHFSSAKPCEEFNPLSSEYDSARNADAYDPSKWNEFQRHVSEWSVEAIVRLKTITLEGELMLLLDQKYPDLLNNWGFGWKENSELTPYQTNMITSQQSMRRCPEENVLGADEEQEVQSNIVIDSNGDCKLEMHDELHRTPLGRKYQNLQTSGKVQPAKKSSPPKGGIKKTPAKRKK